MIRPVKVVNSASASEKVNLSVYICSPLDTTRAMVPRPAEMRLFWVVTKSGNLSENIDGSSSKGCLLTSKKARGNKAFMNDAPSFGAKSKTSSTKLSSEDRRRNGVRLEVATNVEG